MVAPPERFSRSRILAVLLLARTPFSLAALPGPAPLGFGAILGAFLAGLAFLPAFPFVGATCAPRARTWAFFVAFGSTA